MSQESRHLYPDADALAKGAALDLLRHAQRCIAERGIFTLALAGGSTPRKLYSLLATDPAFRDFPWKNTHLFFGDERHVPPSHIDSNYLMVNTTLLSSGGFRLRTCIACARNCPMRNRRLPITTWNCTAFSMPPCGSTSVPGLM